MQTAPVDVSKIQPGDEVTVRLCVAAQSGGAVLVTNGLPYGVWISGDLLAAHHPKPKPLAVGDRVKDVHGGVWEITAPRREGGAVAEYSLWRDGWGYSSATAASVEAWERVS